MADDFDAPLAEIQEYMLLFDCLSVPYPPEPTRSSIGLLAVAYNLFGIRPAK